MEESLTVLYTYGLRGDLDGLPRLYTFIRQLTAFYRNDGVTVCQHDPAPPLGRLLLLDLGDSCAPESWHCAVTGGRSMIVALDGMGYHATNVSGFFAPESRAKLSESTQIKLIDADHPVDLDGILLTVSGKDADDGRPEGHPYSDQIVGTPEATEGRTASGNPFSLTILMHPAEQTRLDGNTLQLARPESTQVGAAQVIPLLGAWKLTHTQIHPLPARIQPDPTIAGVVDFVMGEARYRQKRDQA